MERSDQDRQLCRRRRRVATDDGPLVPLENAHPRRSRMAVIGRISRFFGSLTSSCSRCNGRSSIVRQLWRRRRRRGRRRHLKRRKLDSGGHHPHPGRGHHLLQSPHHRHTRHRIRSVQLFILLQAYWTAPERAVFTHRLGLVSIDSSSCPTTSFHHIFPIRRRLTVHIYYLFNLSSCGR